MSYILKVIFILSHFNITVSVCFVVYDITYNLKAYLMYIVSTVYADKSEMLLLTYNNRLWYMFPLVP